MEGIPKPETRLFFNDIVRLTGPTGTQKYGDDDIKVYKVGQVEVRSLFNTFGFKAQLPNYRTFFALEDVSRENGLTARISWVDNKTPHEWKDCLCAADTIGRAEELLKKFLKQNKKARLKDLVEFNYCD